MSKELEKAIEQSNDFLLAKPYSHHVHAGREVELKIFTPDDDSALRLVIEAAEERLRASQIIERMTKRLRECKSREEAIGCVSEFTGPSLASKRVESEGSECDNCPFDPGQETKFEEKKWQEEMRAVNKREQFKIKEGGKE